MACMFSPADRTRLEILVFLKFKCVFSKSPILAFSIRSMISTSVSWLTNIFKLLNFVRVSLQKWLANEKSRGPTDHHLHGTSYLDWAAVINL